MNGPVPQLRFPGFEEGWEAKTLGDFMTFKNGVNADKDQYGSGTKFINVLDIIAAGPIYHEKIIGRVEVSERELEKNDVRYGDILFQRSSETREEVGQSNIYLDAEKSATFGGFVIRGRPTQEFDPRFFDALLRTDCVRSDLASRSGGSTRFNIGQEALAVVAVTVPGDIPEQQKIADFLGTVDAKIDALRRKKSGLETFKSGLMQRLFTQDLRFTRDDGADFPDWEEKTLGELGSFSKGKGISKSDIVEDGNLPCIRYGEIYTRYRERIIDIASRTDVPASSLTLSQTNDVIIPASGETPIDMARACCVLVAGVALGGDINIYRSPVNGEYVAYLLTNGRRTEIAQMAQGNSVVHLYPAQLRKIVIPVPHPDEQRKIADALTALDAKLAAVANQITHMETFKKGLLQQMFV